MKKIARLLLLPTLLNALPSTKCAQTSGSVLVIRGGTLVEVKSGKEIPDSVIVIRGERLDQIGTEGKLAIPAGAQMVEAGGKWIVPGLIDSHAHADSEESAPLELYIANGVTTIRNPGGNITQLRLLREKLARGETTGPRLFFAGPLLDGLPPVWPAGSLLVDTPERARSAVNFLADQGVDFVKVYNNVKEPELAAIIETAKVRGLPLAGHVPRTMTMTRAIEMGMTRLEHIRITGKEMLSAEEAAAIDPLPVGKREPMLWQRFDLRSEKMRALVQRLAKSGVFLDPTLVTDEYFGSTREAEEKDPNNQYFSKSDVEEALKYLNSGVFETPPELKSAAVEAFQKEQKFVGMCAEAGVRIIAGTDGPGIGLLTPGFALHRELELLAASGLSPLQTLQAATSTAAQALAKEDLLGTVEQGKLADLVILDADPLLVAENLRRVHAVVLGGKTYEPKALLEQAKARVNKKP